jgi:hypothetical protein
MQVSLMWSAIAHLTGGERDELVRRGIPQGSALSSLIAEIVIGRVLGGLADRLAGCLLVTYSDNLGLIGPRREVAAVVDLLRAAFREHAAGPFELTTTDPVPVTAGFRYLGYTWRLVGGELVTEIPADVAVCRQISLQRDASHGSPRELARVQRSIEAQANEWRFWPGVQAWKSEVSAFVEAASNSQATSARWPSELGERGSGEAGRARPEATESNHYERPHA